MYAIGSEYGNSAVSNSLLINTPGSRFCAGQMLDSSLVDFESWEASDQTDLKVSNTRILTSRCRSFLSRIMCCDEIRMSRVSVSFSFVKLSNLTFVVNFLSFQFLLR